MSDDLYDDDDLKDLPEEQDDEDLNASDPASGVRAQSMAKAPPPAMPPMGMPGQGADPRSGLKSWLQQRADMRSGGADPYAGLKDQQRQASDAAARNQLIAGLTKSAAMFGGVGQHKIDPGDAENQANKYAKLDQQNIASQYMAANQANKDIGVEANVAKDVMAPDMARQKLQAQLLQKQQQLGETQQHHRTLENIAKTNSGVGAAARGVQIVQNDDQLPTNFIKQKSGNDSQKAQDKQDKNYLTMLQIDRGGRGAPPQYSKALLAQTSVKNAQKIFADLPKDANGEPDYNQMSSNQVHLLNGELERLATNGSPTESGRQALDAKTFASQWAQIQNRFAGPDGQVAPAQLAPFIKQSAAYIKGLGDVSDQIVHDFRKTNYESFSKADLINDKHRQTYQSLHPDVFAEQKSPGGEDNIATQAASHPQAGAAMDWANTHQLDPDPDIARKARVMLQRLKGGPRLQGIPVSTGGGDGGL